MLQSFKLAIKSIWGNKMRSFLTMLGIIIGVAAVIILVSLVNGYMGSVVESFASMGVNQINVNVTNLTSRTVDVDQMYAFYDEHGDLFDGISPNVSLSATVKKGDDSMSSTSVAGRSEQYLDMKDYDLQLGRNIAYSDIASRQKVCVIGSYVAQELFGSAQKAVSETLKINGYAFKIVGIVETQDEENMEDGGTDDFVWIPYSVATSLAGSANISSYTLTVSDTDNADTAKTLIQNFLYETFKDSDLYRVTAMSEMLDSILKEENGEWLIAYENIKAPFFVTETELVNYTKIETPVEVIQNMTKNLSLAEQKRKDWISELIENTNYICMKNLRNEKVKEIAERFHIKKQRIKNIYYLYLATGGVSRKRKEKEKIRSKELEEKYKNFDWAIKKYYYSAKQMSLEMTYDMMLMICHFIYASVNSNHIR